MVHLNFSAGTYQPCSSCIVGTGTGTGGTGTTVGTGTGTGGTGTGGTGGTVHKLNCGYIKVSIFFSGGTYQPCSSCTGTGGIQPHLQTVNMKLYNVWYMYVYRTHNTKLIFFII